MGEVSIEIDVDKLDKFDIEKSHNPHNGKPIKDIIVSPDEKYIVSYSKEDKSIIGWNVDDIEEGRLKLDNSHPVKPDLLNMKIDITEDKKVFFNTDNKKGK